MSKTRKLSPRSWFEQRQRQLDRCYIIIALVSLSAALTADICLLSALDAPAPLSHALRRIGVLGVLLGSAFIFSKLWRRYQRLEQEVRQMETRHPQSRRAAAGQLSEPTGLGRLSQSAR